MMKKLPVAYQLYSARNEIAHDVKASLQQVKELGFDGVEFAGFYGLSAAEMKAMVDGVGLIPISSHVPLQNILADPEGVIAYHKELGCRYIAVPYLGEDDRPGAPGFARVLALMGQFGRQCRDAGLTLLYHNHDFEFLKVSGIYGLDFIYQAIPADLLQTQIDTCWVKYAGVDPLTYLASYKGRAPVVHLKDFVSDNSGRTPYALIGQDEDKEIDRSGFSFRPFGHGSQDAEGLVKAAVDAGAEWLVIEQDEPHNESPFEDARQGLETLARLGVR